MHDGRARACVCVDRPGGPVVLALLWLLFAAACDGPGTGNGYGVAPALQDEASALDEESSQRIRSYLQFVRDEYGIDYRVITTSDGSETLELAAAERFGSLGVGADSEGRGLLLLLDPEGRRVRVEVGYALEPFLTDVAATRMLNDYLAPWFRSGQIAQGIEASVEALVDKIKPHLEGLGHETPLVTGSGGGGSTADLLRALPEGPLNDRTRSDLRRLLTAQDDPRSARDLEISVMHKGIYFKEAALYDEAWRRADRPGNWSPSRLKKIAEDWDRPYEVLAEDSLAVAYYIDAPALGPTFFRREAEGWVIDASATAESIIYDYSNEGWYALDLQTDYLRLLHRAFDLRRVTLEGGRNAWMVDSRP